MVLWSGMGMEAAASTSTRGAATGACSDRKSTRLNSSHLVISYAVFCLKKKSILEFTILALTISLLPCYPEFLVFYLVFVLSLVRCDVYVSVLPSCSFAINTHAKCLFYS